MQKRSFVENSYSNRYIKEKDFMTYSTERTRCRMKYTIELKPSRKMNESDLRKLKEKVFSKVINDISESNELSDGKKCRQS